MRKIFFLFSIRSFFRFLSENFSDFWPKNFKNLWKLPCACPEEKFVAWIFFKSFEPFWIFCRNLWHGSQNSIYVSTVKIAEETVFLFFFSVFFRILSENFQTFGQNPQEVVKINFCVSRGTICDLSFFLSFESFRIFCRNVWHGSQISIYVSRVKIAERIVFFVFFSEFFRFLSDIF